MLRPAWTRRIHIWYGRRISIVVRHNVPIWAWGLWWARIFWVGCTAFLIFQKHFRVILTQKVLAWIIGQVWRWKAHRIHKGLMHHWKSCKSPEFLMIVCTFMMGQRNSYLRCTYWAWFRQCVRFSSRAWHRSFSASSMQRQTMTAWIQGLIGERGQRAGGWYCAREARGWER